MDRAIFLKPRSFSITLVILIFGHLIILLSCSSYIGRSVGMNHPCVCECQILPKTCILSDDNFKVEYNINELSEANKYLVEGIATYTGSITWENYYGASFTLLLVKDGVIVETVSFSGGQGNLDQTIKFSREFTAQHKFDAVLITLRMNVRG